LTADSILSSFKFTNAHRASDRVSQYLIREIAYSGEQTHDEIFFRILLFKIFNKIETWELLRATLGEICYRDFDFDAYDRVLTDALERKSRIYSAAYHAIGGADGERRKHRSHLKLLYQMMKDQVPLHQRFRSLLPIRIRYSSSKNMWCCTCESTHGDCANGCG
jgi:hypothetical protein